MSANTSRSNIFTYAKDILLDPKKFFEHQHKRITTWREPIKYLIFFTLIVAIFSSVHQLQNLTNISGYLTEKLGLPPVEFTMSNYIAIYCISIMGVFLFTSLRYYLTHKFVTKWNPSAPFKETFKVLAYSTTPGWIGTVFFVLASISLYFAMSTHALWLWMITILLGFFMLFFESYSIYLRCYALSTVQHITRTQALLAIYIYGFLAYILIILLAGVLLGVFILSLVTLYGLS